MLLSLLTSIRTTWTSPSMKSLDGVDQGSGNQVSDPLSFARNIALQQLNYAPRSRKELADKLKGKGVPEDISEQVLDRLTEVGLIDDLTYAQMLVRSKQNSRRLAKRALRVELTKKGISQDIATQVLDEVDPDDELDMARLIVAKKMRSLGSADTATIQRRLSGLLARKGYASNVSMLVIREALTQRSLDIEAEFDAADFVLD